LRGYVIGVLGALRYFCVTRTQKPTITYRIALRVVEAFVEHSFVCLFELAHQRTMLLVIVANFVAKL
jgi:hypothetical protein